MGRDAVNSTLISSALIDAANREVVFTITDDLGRVYGPKVEKRPVAEAVTSFLAAQVADAAVGLREGEIGRNIGEIVSLGEGATPTLLYSTAAQNFAALRLVYQFATRVEAVMIADFLSTLTDAQLRTAFGMTQAEVVTLRANKLTPAAAVADQIRATVGQ
jgi:hypothetical protein